ncbi:MAG: Ni/Fe-hydrogenase, b-type cytochrome subunit [Magnetovibrionaceae bacterium]
MNPPPIDETVEGAAGLADADSSDHLVHRDSVYVYEAPVRMWHWINALAIVVLCLSGYFIGSPLPSMPGEASDHFLMGYIRFAHFAAGYVLAIAFIGRIYWAIVGNHHARQIFYIKFWDMSWWADIGHEIRWYLFMASKPKKYLGHNPLAHLAMFFMFTLMMLFMICTGFALYAEGLGADSWAWSMFGWVHDLFGNPQNLHTWHHVGMWVFVIFIMVHIYAAVREDIMSRQSIISTMISGERMFKDGDK